MNDGKATPNGYDALTAQDHAEIAAVRKLLSDKPRPVGWAQRRERIQDVGAVWPVADDVRVEPIEADGVRGEWSSVAGADASRVLIYLHGGGYCSGSLLSHRRLVTEAGRAVGVRTLAVDYRLAPEHPFPAAPADALAAWNFVRAQGVAARHIAIGGDSAGGGLTCGLISLLRDADEELPGCAWLVSPWTDLTMSGATIESKDDVDPLIHVPYLRELVAAYLAEGTDPRDGRVSPLFADVRGFPPLLIQVGSEETLLDDAVRFAGAAGAASVPVTLEVWPHMIHAWMLWNANLRKGREALAHAGAFIRNALA